MLIGLMASVASVGTFGRYRQQVRGRGGVPTAQEAQSPSSGKDRFLVLKSRPATQTTGQRKDTYPLIDLKLFCSK